MSGFAQGLGSRIAGARQKRGLSQVELADLIPGATQSVVSMWETGAREPSAHSLLLICHALGVTADHLLGLD